MADKKLSLFINRLVPDYVVSEHPQFVLFLRKFFEYIEQEKNSYDIISNLLTYTDVDQTLNEFEILFKQQYLKDFPDVIATDTALLVKNIRSFYASKGTEDSFRFLFRSLYGSDAKIFYPREKILKASAGTWYTPKYLVLTDPSGNIPPQRLDTSIYDVNLLTGTYITGAISGAVAYVDRPEYVDYDAGGGGLEKAISIVDDEGEYILEEQIIVGEPLLNNGHFGYGISSWFSSVDSDTNIISLNSAIKIAQPSELFLGNKYAYTEVSLPVSNEYVLRFVMDESTSDASRVTVGSTPGSNEIYDSGLLGVSPITIEANIDTLAYGKTIYISLHSEHTEYDEYCIFSSVSLIPLDPTTPIFFIANSNGSGIILAESKWLDRQGFLSSDIKIQDNYYYQDYSYEIQSSVSLVDYESLIQTQIHPAGTIMFGKHISDVTSPTVGYTSVSYATMDLEKTFFWENASVTSTEFEITNEPNFTTIGYTYGFVEETREQTEYNSLWSTIAFFETFAIGHFDSKKDSIWPYTSASSIIVV